MNVNEIKNSLKNNLNYVFCTSLREWSNRYCLLGFAWISLSRNGRYNFKLPAAILPGFKKKMRLIFNRTKEVLKCLCMYSISCESGLCDIEYRSWAILMMSRFSVSPIHLSFSNYAKFHKEMHAKCCPMTKIGIYFFAKIGKFGVSCFHAFATDTYGTSHLYQIRHDKCWYRVTSSKRPIPTPCNDSPSQGTCISLSIVTFLTLS